MRSFQSHTCPQCGTTFAVPGFSAKLAEEQRRQTEQEAERRKQAAAAELVKRRNIAHQRAVMAAKAENARSDGTVPFTAGLATMGVLAFAVGILLIFGGLLTDATVSTGSLLTERVYNTGRLATKTTLLTCGTLTFLAGFLMLGLGKLGDEVNRWGNALLRQAETAATMGHRAAHADTSTEIPVDGPVPSGEIG